jgi:hypothetical protein
MLNDISGGNFTDNYIEESLLLLTELLFNFYNRKAILIETINIFISYYLIFILIRFLY